MPEILTFENALQLAGDPTRINLVMGNGFSRALRNDIFSYDAILNSADFSRLSRNARRAFDVLGTTDFEFVVQTLRNAALLIELYSRTNRRLANRLRRDADGLKEVLVTTIAQNHPDLPSSISSDAYASCKRFMSHFNHLFTTNYDLLLYWTLMQSEIEPQIRCDDGFRTPEDGPTDYVAWEPEKGYDQNVHYLHGALHLFDAGTEIQKYTWVNVGKPLIQQIREALEQNYFPLFVSEGDSDKKYTKIQHSAYLSKGFRSLVSTTGVLFTYGLSFSESDNHIAKAIEKGKFSALAVSVYGDPNSPTNAAMIHKTNTIAAGRPPKKPLAVIFYDAASAHVWG
ncbi:MAG: DUF4917 family protein [Anaerolineales bacterium]|nr:MAG: DUF4917 family protein [Anaerolineales bacterium]